MPLVHEWPNTSANTRDEHMSVFDIANNMTAAATEQDEFSVIQITQPQMDELAGSEGFLTYTSPSTRDLYILSLKSLLVT